MNEEINFFKPKNIKKRKRELRRKNFKKTFAIIYLGSLPFLLIFECVEEANFLFIFLTTASLIFLQYFFLKTNNL